MAKRLLLVDDEPLIIKGLRFSLEQDGYECDSAVDGEEAIAKFEQGRYDLILLDVMLPKLSGTEVCQRIREHSNVPIIMLTAKGEDMDKILGLEYGADDYMTKPFNILEVKARIKTILRRAQATPPAAEENKIIRVRDMEVNLVNRSVKLAGKDVKLHGEGVRPAAAVHHQPRPRLQPREHARNRLEVRLSRRYAHRRRAYPPPARED